MVKRSGAILNAEKDPGTQNLGLFEKKLMSLWAHALEICAQGDEESIETPHEYCQFAYTFEIT